MSSSKTTQSPPLAGEVTSVPWMGYDGEMEEKKKHGKKRPNKPLARTDADLSGPNDAAQIYLGQKMLSAVSGSLLTSILVTPLDVVRVRLQSQPLTTASPFLPTGWVGLASTSFSRLPPDIGVTACCREVFWVNNNAQYCLAGPGNPYLANGSPSALAAADCAVHESQRQTFTSTFDGLKKIARNEGIGSLWRGLSPTLVMAIPANVIYFTGYDWLRSSKQSPIKNHVSEKYSPLIAGSLARICAATLISPIEMFRTRLQASNGRGGVFAETLSELGEIVHTQGYRSLWRGLTLTLWRDVPFSGIYWWGYESARASLTRLRENRHLTSPQHILLGPGTDRTSTIHDNHTVIFADSFIAGAVSGAIASVITTPFDVGKTRRQVFMHSPDTPAQTTIRGLSAPEEKSMPRFLWHIFKHEGAAGLFRGWVARVLKVAPACAIMISSYEVGKKMARNSYEKQEMELWD
ncbi:MAG: hypothetical protein M1829_005265 [Trizodia sp. TS-e1964]|nr:MAG: hypothetical protein M1829_005265 [Trizodia sp. TS-e1964]